jgi:hypothetical protein
VREREGYGKKIIRDQFSFSREEEESLEISAAPRRS